MSSMQSRRDRIAIDLLSIATVVLIGLAGVLFYYNGKEMNALIWILALVAMAAGITLILKTRP